MLQVQTAQNDSPNWQVTVAFVAVLQFLLCIG